MNCKCGLKMKRGIMELEVRPGVVFNVPSMVCESHPEWESVAMGLADWLSKVDLGNSDGVGAWSPPTPMWISPDTASPNESSFATTAGVTA